MKQEKYYGENGENWLHDFSHPPSSSSSSWTTRNERKWWDPIFPVEKRSKVQYKSMWNPSSFFPSRQFLRHLPSSTFNNKKVHIKMCGCYSRTHPSRWLSLSTSSCLANITKGLLPPHRFHSIFFSYELYNIKGGICMRVISFVEDRQFLQWILPSEKKMDGEIR